jgi:hypothetical protein
MGVVSKIAYKSVNRVTGMLAGAVAAAVFSWIWGALSNSDEAAPDPGELDHRTREVLLAAVLQGAVFSLVKAGMERAIAKSARRLSR